MLAQHWFESCAMRSDLGTSVAVAAAAVHQVHQPIGKSASLESKAKGAQKLTLARDTTHLRQGHTYYYFSAELASVPLSAAFPA